MLRARIYPHQLLPLDRPGKQFQGDLSQLQQNQLFQYALRRMQLRLLEHEAAMRTLSAAESNVPARMAAEASGMWKMLECLDGVLMEAGTVAEMESRDV